MSIEEILCSQWLVESRQYDSSCNQVIFHLLTITLKPQKHLGSLPGGCHQQSPQQIDSSLKIFTTSQTIKITIGEDSFYCFLDPKEIQVVLANDFRNSLSLTLFTRPSDISEGPSHIFTLFQGACPVYSCFFLPFSSRNEPLVEMFCPRAFAKFFPLLSLLVDVPSRSPSRLFTLSSLPKRELSI
jgi:hypothetical protein